jgi:hypothetical protein
MKVTLSFQLQTALALWSLPVMVVLKIAVYLKSVFIQGAGHGGSKITIKKNGPYRVEAPEGAIQLVDSGRRENMNKLWSSARLMRPFLLAE